jgi:O-antigen ligase
LQSFWPLQHYTPHQNVLWLWLKTGIIGITAFLALWALAISRCIRYLRANREYPMTAIVIISSLLMFAIFATVDQGLVVSRAAIPFGAAIGAAFALPRQPAEEADSV